MGERIQLGQILGGRGSAGVCFWASLSLYVCVGKRVGVGVGARCAHVHASVCVLCVRMRALLFAPHLLRSQAAGNSRAG